MGCHSILIDNVEFAVFNFSELYFLELRFVVGLTSSAENKDWH